MDSKKIALAGVLAVLLTGGLTAMAGCSSDDSEPATTTQTTTSSEGSSENSDQAATGSETAKDKEKKSDKSGGGSQNASQPGEYVDYSPELVASTPGDKLLFFHASWCSQCVALEEDIEASGLPDGVTIFKVDYDSNQDLRQEYGVTLQTTMVKVDENGEMIDSYVAFEEPTFDNVSAALLQ